MYRADVGAVRITELEKSEVSGGAFRKGERLAIRDFDGDPSRLTDMDALIAYLQMLGTTVDFSTYHAEAPANQR